MTVKEIELRLAFVFYGGVSLAIYIHGVTRELLNIVRASKAFHARGEAAQAEPLSATEDSVAVYRRLLEDLSPSVSVRVVIDIISGASAGGMNGIMLASAIAHDLPLDSHRDLWLRNADVTHLSAPSKFISRTVKAMVAPAIDRLLSRWLGAQAKDPETRMKLRRFMQARWFRPPFSGSILATWMLDGYDAMMKVARPGASLLPPGHRLDLFVTVTDFRGRRQRVVLHDPPAVEETEHRRILAFTCRRSLSGKLESDLAAADVPGLVFAARATSSFPGAFVPATIAEIDRLLARRGQTWAGRDDFLRRKLDIGSAQQSADAYFIDGSVVMNKPFSPVLQALGDRPAAREVARRIVYVDPNPGVGESARGAERAPGFFRTILASMAQIPRNEPIADDLKAIADWNARARRLSEIVAAADPEVERLVAGIVRDDPADPPTIAEVGAWRSAANEAAFVGAGYTYLSYRKLKLRALVDRLSGLVAGLAGRAGQPIESAAVASTLIRLFDADPAAGTAGAPGLVHWLRAFDVDFRIRRVRFVIRRLNDLYRAAVDADSEIDPRSIDSLKAELYQVVDRMTKLWAPATHAAAAAEAAARIAAAIAKDAEADPGDLGVLEAALDLVRVDRSLDEIVSVMGLGLLPPRARRALSTAYVGFAFYDLITLPILQWTDLAEINEALVDRISPEDTRGPRPGPVALRGTALMNFGAFFNRAWREHDYLWGRLNAAERCVDMVLSAVGSRAGHLVDPEQVRARLFRAILRAEATHLTADPELVPGLLRDVDARYGAE